MIKQIATGRTGLEPGDRVRLRDGSEFIVDRIQFIQELPCGNAPGSAWFQFHLPKAPTVGYYGKELSGSGLLARTALNTNARGRAYE